MRRRAAGFTLIELLVVIAMIGILAAVAVGQYHRAIIKAKEAVLKENLFHMREGINNYFADKGKYPSDLHALVEEKYLRTMPRDPITESPDSWQVTYAQLGDEDISTEPGITDVHSGATGVSPIEGTSYADW
ncbi:MAG TPA: type II secretion system protein [Candidatus Polarisedimenticolaceae bacterium]|nr:type II secretion system protein [Candidatus Polarisedimenticolaceae bacterium]